MKPLLKHIEDIYQNGISSVFTKLYNYIYYRIYVGIKKFYFIIKLGLIFGFYKKENSSNFPKKILLGSYTWNEKYINKLTKVSIPSFFSENNIPNLIRLGFEIEYIIVAEKNEKIFNLIKDVVGNLLLKNDLRVSDVKIEFIIKKNMTYDNLAEYMNIHFQESINRNAIWFMIPSDHVITDGGVTNLITMVDSNDCCVATPCFRVERDKFLNEFSLTKNNTKEKILELAFRFLYLDVTNSFRDSKNNVSWTSGLSIEDSSDGYLATNTLPATICGKISESDMKYYKKYRANIHDHLWPSKLLIERRLRVVPSSDVCFIAELTGTQDPKYQKLKRLEKWYWFRDYPLRYNFENRRNIHSVVMGSYNYHLNYNRGNIN